MISMLAQQHGSNALIMTSCIEGGGGGTPPPFYTILHPCSYHLSSLYDSVCDARHHLRRCIDVGINAVNTTFFFVCVFCREKTSK